MTKNKAQQFGRYTVIRPIGVGSLGRVYLARDEMSEQTVALKVFDPPARDAAERLFMSEARLASQLRHPNIATIHEVGHEQGVPYVAMECVFNGRSLARHCESSADRLPLEDTIRIVRACANGLQHAHERGVVHKDVKPRNILLDVGLVPKLVDFGFSVVGNLMRGGPNASLAGSRYQAPEQLLDHTVGTQADIFSLGVVLYELLAGRHPFDGSGIDERREQVLRVRHTPVRKFRSDAPGFWK
jgi:serine/threonine protein kinase